MLASREQAFFISKHLTPHVISALIGLVFTLGMMISTLINMMSGEVTCPQLKVYIPLHYSFIVYNHTMSFHSHRYLGL